MLGASIEIGDNLLIVLMALIPSIPATIAAIGSVRNGRQLKPNGGTSMHDKLDKVYRTVSATDRAEDDAAATVTVDKGSTSTSTSTPPSWPAP